MCSACILRIEMEESNEQLDQPPPTNVTVFGDVDVDYIWLEEQTTAALCYLQKENAPENQKNAYANSVGELKLAAMDLGLEATTDLKKAQSDPTKYAYIPNVNDYNKDFFGSKTNLTVSGQLEAELAAMGLGQVYTFGPTFRAENSNTSRHLSEFWMIEPEIAFCDLKENIELSEEFLKYVVNYALDHCNEDLIFLKEIYKT